MKRFLYVISDFQLTQVPGHLGAIINYFKGNSWEIDILTDTTPINKDIDNIDGTKVIKTKDENDFIKYLYENIKNYNTVFTYNQRNINSHLPFLKRKYKIAYIIKTDMVISKFPYYHPIKLFKWFMKTYLPIKFANMVLVETPQLQKRLQKINKNVFLFPNSISLQKMEKIEKNFIQKNIKTSKKNCILFTGRIHPVKRLDILIEAFSRISNLYPNWKIEIVGPVQDKNYYETILMLIRDKNIEDKVTFTPFLHGEELYKKYFLADIFCLPSKSEGMPQVLIEAMFFKNAIISTNIGAIPFQLNDNECGILIEPNDVESLQKNLSKLIEEELLRKTLGEKARKRVEKLFTWEKNLRVFDNFINGK